MKCSEPTFSMQVVAVASGVLEPARPRFRQKKTVGILSKRSWRQVEHFVDCRCFGRHLFSVCVRLLCVAML